MSEKDLPERIERVVDAILACEEEYSGFAFELAEWVKENWNDRPHPQAPVPESDAQNMVRRCRDVLLRRILPDSNLSDWGALNDLYGILDDAEQVARERANPAPAAVPDSVRRDAATVLDYTEEGTVIAAAACRIANYILSHRAALSTTPERDK